MNKVVIMIVVFMTIYSCNEQVKSAHDKYSANNLETSSPKLVMYTGGDMITMEGDTYALAEAVVTLGNFNVKTNHLKEIKVK